MKIYKNFIAAIVLIVLSFSFLFASPSGKTAAADTKQSVVRIADHFSATWSTFSVPDVRADRSATCDSRTEPAAILNKFLMPGNNYAGAYRRAFSPPYEVLYFPKDWTSERTLQRDDDKLIDRKKPEIVRKAS